MAELNVSYNGAIARVSWERKRLPLILVFFIFCCLFLFFVLPAWQPTRLRAYCQCSKGLASIDGQHATIDISLASDGIISIFSVLHHPPWVFYVASCACSIQCFGWKCFSSPIDPHPFIKSLTNQCEPFFSFFYFDLFVFLRLEINTITTSADFCIVSSSSAVGC